MSVLGGHGLALFGLELVVRNPGPSNPEEGIPLYAILISSFLTNELPTMSQLPYPEKQDIPEPNHLKDLKLAASKMSGTKRRAFQAEMALMYCESNPRRAESLFGWSRQAVELGFTKSEQG